MLMMMLLMNFLFFGCCCFSILMRFLMLFSDPECGTQCPNCKSAILYRSHQYSLHIWRSCCHCVCLLSLSHAVTVYVFSLSLSLFRLLICLLVCLSPHSLNLILAALNVEMGVSFLSFLIYSWELLLEFQCVR